MPRNILIFHSGALGDFVLNWPVAMAAARLFPQSRIFYVTGEQKGKLAERALGVESRDSEAGWHRLHGRDPQLPEPVLRMLAGAHTVFSFVNRAGDAWESNVRRLAPSARLHCLHPTPPADYPRHATRFVLAQLSADAAMSGALEQMLRSVASRGVGSISGGGITFIHPGAGSPDKCWPLERFGELARRLIERGHQVRVLLGEVEAERLAPRELDCFPSGVEHLRLETPLQLYEQFVNARLLIGNDSGPAHLAGILGVPVVAIFGPTSVDVWKPLGPNVRTVRGMPLRDLGVEEVERVALGVHGS